MQNSSPNQMKMLTTRIGVNSKMVITGDIKQSDMTKENGLADFINKIKLYEKNNSVNEIIKLVELSTGDIERSEVVRKVINIYDNKET
jgi:phosphate starvation-inducible PhoH-like protein